MSRPMLCPNCHAPVSDGVAGGYCTACLLEEGLNRQGLEEKSIPIRDFGDYELLEEIARGGMGVVFRARQHSLNRIVAVKMILSGHLASEVQVQRFRAEARAAAALQHPGIVAIHEVGEHEGLLFFSMAYVDGQNLAQLVRSGPLSSPRAARCVRDIAEAIHYAHELGVIHRDLKPSNVLIDASGNPHVTDFGLAKQLNPDDELATDDPHVTQTGQVLGSPNFMPPEQAAGRHHELTRASDVYSLGALLFHLITGRPPFLAESIPATLRLVYETEPIAPRLLAPGVPRDLETICLKCLEKDPSRRYATAQELAQELDRFLRLEPIRARPAGVVLKFHRWCLRNRPLAGAGLAISALLLLVAVGSPIALLRIDGERKRAESNLDQAKREAARSRQVATILEDMLLAAGPSVARGRDSTVLREMLERTSDRLAKEKSDQPEVQGDIWLTLGRTYRDMGDYTQAIHMFGKAEENYRLAFGSEHPKLAQALAQLGRCQSFTGKVEPGNGNALRGLQMARKFDDPETLVTCLVNAGYSFQAWGLGSTQAMPYWREAVALREGQKTNEVALADCLRTLAASLTDDNEAEALLRRALALHQRHLEPDHPAIASDWWGLGQNLLTKGQLEEAERTLRKAVDLYQKIYATSHPHRAIVIRHLTESLVRQGKTAEAASILREQLEQRKKVSGKRHAETVNLYFNLASVLTQANKPIEAEALYREMIEEHPEVAGHLYGRAGRWKEAAAAFAQRSESEPKNPENYRLRVPLLLLIGDLSGYRQMCSQTLVRFGTTDDPVLADAIVRVCLLHPDSGMNLQTMADLADLAIGRGKKRPQFPWFELGKGLSEFRRHRFLSAANWVSQALGNPDPSERQVAAYSILAMARWQLQQPDLAQEALTKASELAAEKMPKMDGGDIPNWADVIGAHLLMREAKALIEGHTPGRP